MSQIGVAMPVEIGRIEAMFRYPVKSMRGEPLAAASLGWHGLEGDRRFAFRRLDERGGFPWLTASRLPDLLLFTPQRHASGADGNDQDPPTHVVTPEGNALPLFGDELAREIARRSGVPVEMMHLTHGMFDDATISVIASETVREISRVAMTPPDLRRFRPNIVVRSMRAVPFEEDEWLGGVLTFGDAPDAPAVTVTAHDVRCVMVNLDPDGGGSTPDMLKSVVRLNRNNAGIYATVTRVGRLAVGQSVVLHPLGEAASV